MESTTLLVLLIIPLVHTIMINTQYMNHYSFFQHLTVPSYDEVKNNGRDGCMTIDEQHLSCAPSVSRVIFAVNKSQCIILPVSVAQITCLQSLSNVASIL